MNLSDFVPAEYKLAAKLAVCAILIGIGAVGAWKVQAYRLDALQARFDGFVAQTKAEGEKAAIAALAIQKANERRKEQADHEISIAIAALHADNNRMRNARTIGSYLPAAATGAGRPDRITFDRAELESAIRLFDQEVSGIVGKGDENGVKLDTVRKWAQDPATGMKLATGLQ